MKEKFQAASSDIEAFHKIIMEGYNSGKYESCLDSLVNYVRDNDIDLELVKMLISPSLKARIHDEAIEQNLMSKPLYSVLNPLFFE